MFATGFVHRNLKTDVLLCNEDATEVKISDFSLARSTLDSMPEYTNSPMWYEKMSWLYMNANYSHTITVQNFYAL